jgi:hypothetical protein
MSSAPKLCADPHRLTVTGRKPPRTESNVRGQTVNPRIQGYLNLGYTAVSHVLIDHWMSTMSGTEFKLAVLFLRETIGHREKRTTDDLQLGMTLAQMQERTGADREAVVRAIRDLETKKLVTARRVHRKMTVYTLDLEVLLRPWIGETDSSNSAESEIPTQTSSAESGMPTQEPLRVGETDPTDSCKVGNADPSRFFESGEPTQNGGLESGFPTLLKEIRNKAAAAGSSREPTREDSALTPAEWAEVRRIEQHAGVQLDGKNAAVLKAGAEGANLTLSHLRWFLGKETFAAARNRTAVLLTIAREFRERAEGMEWPADLNGVREKRGLTREERLGL